jgi:hypothetical protein
MTIPVIPGPWSFVERIGQAAGAIGSEMRNRYLQDQQLAQQDADLILRIVQQTGDPRMINHPSVQAALGGALGAAPGIMDVLLTPEQQKGASIQAMPESPRRDTALGIPTKAESRAGEAKAGITADYLEGVQTGTPQAAAVAGGPTAGAAAAADVGAQAQVMLPLATQAAQAAITQIGITNLLDNNGNVTDAARKTAYDIARAAVARAGLQPNDAYIIPLVDSALEMTRFNLRQQELDAMAAQARLYGTSTDTVQAWQRQQQNALGMVEQLTKDIQAIPGWQVYDTVNQRLSRGESPSDIGDGLMNIYLAVAPLVQQREMWRQMATQAQTGVQTMINQQSGFGQPGQIGAPQGMQAIPPGQAIPRPGQGARAVPGTTQPRPFTQEQMDKAIQAYATLDPAVAEQMLQTSVANGEILQSDADNIRAAARRSQAGGELLSDTLRRQR